MTTNPLRVFRVMTALFLLLYVLAACGSKVNEGNYSKIDMTEEQVKAILDAPAETSSSTVADL